MKIAISTVCLHQMPWQRTFEYSAAAGFTNIELLMIPGWKHVQPGAVPSHAIAAKAAEIGVQVVALHAGGLDGTSDASIASSISYIDRIADYALDLGAEIVVASGMPTPEGTDAAGRANILARIADGVAALEPKLGRRGVTLGIENHYGCQTETIDDFEILFQRLPRSPFIGITADTGHFTASGVDVVDFAEQFGPRIVHVHMKDHIGVRSVGLGYGNTDNRGFVSELANHDYSGFLSVEMEVEDGENIERYMREALPYVAALCLTPEVKSTR